MRKRIHFASPKFSIACSIQFKTDSFERTTDWMNVTCKRCLKKRPTMASEMAKCFARKIDSQIIKEMLHDN